METKHEPQANTTTTKRALLILNCIILSIGNCGGPLIMRLCFMHGGNRVWLSSCLQTCAWPIIFLPLLVSYLHRQSTNPAAKIFSMKPPLFVAAAFIGVLSGLDNYLYGYGVARLPVSTSSLIIATQLAFIAGFAILLVKHKFTSFSINATVLLTVGAGVWALHTSSDQPDHESNEEYILGFIMTLLSAAPYGLILPLMELIYDKSKQEISYKVVLEIQMVLCLFATVFCTSGMLINNDFKVIQREGKQFELGEAKYYVIMVCSAIIWQCFFLGTIGLVFCASSMLSGIIIVVLFPVTKILAVIFYQEKFQAEKGVALAFFYFGFCFLLLW